MVLEDKSYCSNCNSYRPLDHAYCYVCGLELKILYANKNKPKLKPKLETICRICHKPFTPLNVRQTCCNDMQCRKLVARLNVNNWYKRKKGKDVSDILESRFCKNCFRPIPLERLTNSLIITCSEYCSKVLNAERNRKFYKKRREALNGKTTIPTV